jgi:hypothetical protein
MAFLEDRGGDSNQLPQLALELTMKTLHLSLLSSSPKTPIDQILHKALTLTAAPTIHSSVGNHFLCY